MTDKFQNKYRRESTRLKNWDYGSNAAYFVTICTANREYFFGDIVDGEMILSEIGKIAHKFWKKIPQHFPFIELDAFIIMPNHMHGIIIIDKMDDCTDENNRTDVTCQNEGTDVACNVFSDPADSADFANPVDSANSNKNKKMAAISPKSGSLSTIIRSYKSAVTKHARQMGFDFAWQSRFHSLSRHFIVGNHVIRNDESYERINNYIISNPEKWQNDKFCE